MGKVWRYSEDVLGETLKRCAEYYRRPPLVAEFACGATASSNSLPEGNNALHLPSGEPVPAVVETWEAALLHFGYTPDQVAERLEQL